MRTAGILILALAAASSLASEVGYWSFDESAGLFVGDSTTYNNFGTLVNLREDTWVPGVSGTAMYFPGITGEGSTRVNVSSNASLQMTGAISMAAWAYCFDLGRDAPILAKEGPNGQNSYWFGVFGPSGGGHWGILLDHDGYWNWDMNGRDLGNMPGGQWVHLATTWDGSVARYYLNGQPTGTLNWQNTLFAGTSYVSFGVNSNFNYTAYNGIADEIHLYNTAITPAEVAALASTRAITGRVLLEDWTVIHKGCVVQIEASTGGTVLESTTVTLGYNGMYSVPTSLTGEYDVSVKSSHWLRKTLPAVNLQRVNSNLNFVLTNGDVDGDNEVGPGDFGQLSAAFGSAPGDGNWNVEADLDGDIEVGPSDFGVLSANFGMSGD